MADTENEDFVEEPRLPSVVEKAAELSAEWLRREISTEQLQLFAASTALKQAQFAERVLYDLTHKHNGSWSVRHSDLTRKGSTLVKDIATLTKLVLDAQEKAIGHAMRRDLLMKQREMEEDGFAKDVEATVKKENPTLTRLEQMRAESTKESA